LDADGIPAHLPTPLKMLLGHAPTKMGDTRWPWRLTREAGGTPIDNCDRLRFCTSRLWAAICPISQGAGYPSIAAVPINPGIDVMGQFRTKRPFRTVVWVM
jgi:hypothetical protein